MQTTTNRIYIVIFIITCMAIPACDSNIPYENSSLNGCYAMDNDIFNQLWFDGVSEFVEIYYTPISGSVSYAGSYTISGHELYLNYYGYDPETYELYLYNSGFTLDGTWYGYVGEECL